MPNSILDIGDTARYKTMPSLLELTISTIHNIDNGFKLK